MQRALESAMAELILGPELDPSDPTAVRTWLERSGVSEDDAAYIADNGVEQLLVYRQLVRGTLWEALELSIPSTMARLGDVFEEYFDRFLAERAPRTHYLKDVIYELLGFCDPLWKDDTRVPEYILDLARHESLQIEIGSMEALPPDHEPGPLELDRGVRFIDASRVVHYGYAVHELPEGEVTAEPEQKPCWLLVYRSPEHEVRYLELTPLAAAILERLHGRGLPLGEAVTGACAERGTPPSEKVLEGTAKLLADLADRGALLGAR